MALILPKEIASYFPEAFVISLANKLNDTEEHIRAVIKYGILVICWLVIDRQEREGSNTLLNLAKHSLAAGYPEKFSNSSSVDSVFMPDQTFAEDLSEGRHAQICVRISNFTRVKAVTVRGIMQILAPLTLSILGKHAIIENWKVNDLSAWIQSQRIEILQSLPAGLNLTSLSAEVRPVTEPLKPKDIETQIVRRRKMDYTPVLTIILILIAAVVIFICYRNWSLSHGDPLHLKSLF